MSVATAAATTTYLLKNTQIDFKPRNLHGAFVINII